MRALTATLLLALTACPESAQGVRLQVVDVWGDPVEGAMVLIEGLPEQLRTDAFGHAFLPVDPGPHTLHAGHKEFIQATAQIDIEAGQQLAPMELFPRPDRPGFHLVGASGYVPLQAVPIQAMGNELKTLYGLKSMGEAHTDIGRVRILFHTGDLSLAQVRWLEPEVHRLAYIDNAAFTSAITTTAKVKLWASEGRIEAQTVRRLGSKQDYLLELGEELPEGDYALATESMLTPGNDESFRRLPDKMRVAFPFRVD